jgi:hypothetical protein
MFWNKKAKNTNIKNDADRNKIAKKPEYVITLYDKMSSSAREVDTFVVTQERDEKDGLLYLQTGDGGETFKALFPSRKNVLRDNRTKEQIKSEIQALKTKTFKETENPLNIQSKIRKLELILYFLEHPSGDFISFDSDGMPHIRFLRSNSNFIPLVWDINLNSIYIPSEPNLKDSMQTIIDKKEKYKLKKDKLKGILEAIMWIIIVVFICVNAYWSYHNMTWADSKSSVALIQKQIESGQIVCNNALAKSVETNVQTTLINSENAKTTQSLLQNLSQVLVPKVSNAVAVEDIR